MANRYKVKISDEIDGMIGGAKELGGRYFTTRLLEVYCQSISKGQPVDLRIQEFVCNAFDKIIAGEKPELALNLNKKKGRKPDSKTTRRDMLIAAAVIDRRAAGENYKKVKPKIAKELHVSEATIKAAYETYGPTIKNRMAWEIKQAVTSPWDPPQSATDLVNHWMTG